eukprot:9314073-Heterocapsa_arctica.AAC.1
MDLVLAPKSLGRCAPRSSSGFPWPPFAWGSLGRSSWVSIGQTCAGVAKSLRSSWPPVSRGPSYAGNTSWGTHFLLGVVFGGPRSCGFVLSGLRLSGPGTSLASSPWFMRTLRIRPGSSGCSLMPDLGLFRPE